MSDKNYKGIWVFAEQCDGILNSTVFELLAKAQELKAHCGENITAVLLGKSSGQLPQTLIACGADQVIAVENDALAEYSARPYQKALTQLVNKYLPSILLYGATSIGRDLAPRMMVSLSTGLTADAVDLGFDEDGVFYQTTPGYGGKILAHIVILERRPQMATVRPQMFEPLAPDESRQGQIIHEDARVCADGDYQVLGSEKKVFAGTPVDQARVLVSGGRGVKKAEDLALLHELATLLGGEVSGSRPLIDSGLLKHEVQIGQSGKTVKPNLMINVAISGSVQYKVGMQNAKNIISINSNPKAPIFEISKYGAVADFRAVLPAVIAELKKRED